MVQIGTLLYVSATVQLGLAECNLRIFQITNYFQLPLSPQVLHFADPNDYQKRSGNYRYVFSILGV